MEINVTLVIQMLVFAAFVWFTMKFVWPPLARALEERQDKIADGLAAAERGRRELELAQHRIKDEMKQAKAQATDILDKANRRAIQIIDDAKQDAQIEAQKMVAMAKEQISQEVIRARSELRKELSSLAIAGAEKILAREIDEHANQTLLHTLLEEI